MRAKAQRKENVMKKLGQYIALALLMLSNVPVQAMSLDNQVKQEAEILDSSEANDETVSEQEVLNESLDNRSELPESTEQDLKIEDSVTEESVEIGTSPESIEMDGETDSSEEDAEESQSVGTRSFTNSEIVNGVRYEWTWDPETRSLDFNANEGNSQDAIQIMNNNGLIGVQYLTLRNLNEVTQDFQALNELMTVVFFNVTTIGTAAFQNHMNLKEITFHDAIRVQASAFQGCQNLVKVNNSLSMEVILTDAFNGTAIEEIEVNVAWRVNLATPLSLRGMNSLRKLVNHGGGGNFSNFLGADLPALEVYEGHSDGASMLSGLTTFLNSRAPNLRQVHLYSIASSSSYVFDQLDLRNVSHLEEFIFEHSNSPGNHTLGSNAFQGLEHLRTVRIDGITGISENAFRNTPNLEEVLLNRVNTIGNNAFNDTPSLKSVHAPQLERIGNSVFTRTGLEEIYFPVLEEAGNSPFERNDHLLKADLPNLRLGGSQLFAFCPSLEEVNLPMLERINSGDFMSTNRLEVVYLPSAISVIGTLNFHASGVKSLVLPKIDITQADRGIFRSTSLDYLEVAYASDASNLKNILNSLNTEISVLKINEQKTFGNEYTNLSDFIRTLEKIILPNTTNIGDGMFRGMTSLKEISAPQLVEIGNEAFRNTGLMTVDLPELESAGSLAFAETNDLVSATLDKVSSLGHSVFYKSRVEKVVVSVIKELPRSTFEKCTRLVSVSMPNVEYIGNNAFSDTKSLKKLETPNVRDILSHAFFNSGIIKLDLPKLTSLGGYTFQGTDNLESLNMPLIQDIAVIDSMFYLSGLPYGINIPMDTIHGIDTSMRNQSGIEVIMTSSKNREVIKPLTIDENDRILAIASDGKDVIQSGEDVINLETGDRVDIPVYTDIIINDSIKNVKANVDHVWLHDGNPMEFGSSLVIENVMPWHNGVYQRHLSVNYSITNEKIFSYDSNTVTLNVSYTNELDIDIVIDDPEITIGDSTTVTATIENVTSYGEVDVSIDLVSGLLGGVELVENSISSVLNGGGEKFDSIDLGETVTIPQDGNLKIIYEVLGVNNESIENNIQVILTEENMKEEAHTWANASRLIVNNGRLRFTSKAPEIIAFNQWDESNPLMLGAITTQLSPFKLEVEDLRGSNTFAQNEIKGSRSNWRVEVLTDNVFIDETSQESRGLLQLLAQTEEGHWHNAKDGIPLYTHVTNKELPLSSRYQSINVGDGAQLGIMLNQLTGLIENSTYSVDMTFNLVDAP